MKNERVRIASRLASSRWPVQLLLALLVAFSVASAGPPGSTSQPGGGKLKVMTYNVYIGTEYAGVTTRDFGKFLEAVTNFAAEIRASDPPGRAEAVARQIVATSPHLVSLQEVVTLSTGPTRDDLTLEVDYLELLLQALADQGVPYRPVVSLETWDVTVPDTLGFVRNTWRVVVLARADLKPAHLSFANPDGDVWTATLVPHLYALDGLADLCPVPLTPSDGTCRMPFPRGWVSVDVTYRGEPFRFIGAHLDSASHLLEIPQALELLAVPADTALPVVVAADLNTDCSDPEDPTYPTCERFREAGFADAWTVARPSESGYSKHLPDLTERSDYVMVRDLFGVQSAALVGEEPADMTTKGRYPSDHAGVVVKLEHPGVDGTSGL